MHVITYLCVSIYLCLLYLYVHVGKPVGVVTDCIGPEVDKATASMQPGDLLMLENLRFHKEEETNDPAFAKELAKHANIYVNDAFGTAHRY
jgi:phosphoglycerate kinase